MLSLRRFASIRRSLLILSPSRSYQEKKTPVPRTSYTAHEISDMILRRLHLREQRGLVKALIIGSGIVISSSVIFLYVFRKPLKDQTVAQVADVAKSSLEQGDDCSSSKRTSRSLSLCIFQTRSNNKSLPCLKN